MYFRSQYRHWLFLILVAILALPTLIHFDADSHPAEAAIHSYTANPNVAIPPGLDFNCAAGAPGTSATSTITVPDNFTIADVDVLLNITHTWVGDLVITLTHGATTVTLVDRVGFPVPQGCQGFFSQNITTRLNDESAGGPVENADPPTGASYTPQQALSAFDGQNASGNWTLTVTDWITFDSGTLVSWGLDIDDGVPTTPLTASAVCNLDNLNVTITAGDTPFNITGTGPGLPLNNVAAGTFPLTGPGTWTGVTVTEVGGNGQSTNLGNFNCATIPLVASAVCNLDNLNVTITAGDTPFNITGTGWGLPWNNVGAGTFHLTGPGTWTGVTVTEVGGNGQSTNLGDFNCATIPLAASAVCNLDNLNVTITAGDTPFIISFTGPGLPWINVAAGTFPLTGPGTWIAVTVTEIGGNGQSTNLGNFNCATIPLAATAVCNLDNLNVTITAGDTPFNVTGTGPGLPLNNVTAGTFPLTGPGSWTGVTVTEVGGNGQSTNLGNFNCATVSLAATAVCNLDNLNVTITAGDTPFNVTGTGPGLPLNNVTAGTFPLTGPGNWTGVTVTEVGGNGQSTNLGNFTCATIPLAATAVCNLNNLNVTITAGDTPFNVTGTGPGLPLNGVTAGTFPLTGPGSWTGVTVTEVGGNGQSTNLGDFNCATIPLNATAFCTGDNLNIGIIAGDGPFNVTGTGPGLPMNNVPAATFPLTGPGSWQGVTVTEVGGNGQSTLLGDFNCATNTLTTSAVCNLDNLMISITAGDTPFNVTGTGPGLPLNSVTTGIYPLTGPGNWTGVTVTEVGGNHQSTLLGDFNCATNGLNATAQCIGSELWINIVNGDAPFNVTGTGPGLPLSNVATSTFFLPGAGTWASVVVTEVGGNQQAFAIGNFTCGGGIPVPNLGLIKIDTGQAQFALQAPNGAPLALKDGTPVLLPADADHNGYDTYNVTGIVVVDGDYWLSIFLGNTTWGWVPLDLVTPLTQLTLPEASSSSTTK